MPPGSRLPFDPIAEARRQWLRRWGAAEPMAAATSIMRAQQIVLARVDGMLRPFQLTFARYEALVLLAFARSRRLPMRVMGERLQLHPTSVTNIVDRLQADGLVRRVPHPTDRRTTIVVITEHGRERVHGRFRLRPSRRAEVVAGADTAQLAAEARERAPAARLGV